MEDVKDIKNLVSEYISGLENIDSVRYHRAWPLIAGPSLRRTTEFRSFENGKIYVHVRGASARNLLMLEKGRILKDFNMRFPDARAEDIYPAR